LGWAASIIAAEGRQTLAMLRRREDEPSDSPLMRPDDMTVASASIDDVYIDEVNTPES
jgi:hypothetical protein